MVELDFEEIYDHFETKYGIDLYDVFKNQLRPYFNFWHWLLTATEKKYPFKTLPSVHTKTVPLSHDLLVAPTEEQLANRVKYAEMLKSFGAPAPASYGEAPDEVTDILNKIFSDFGSDIMLRMEVSR